MPGCTPSAVRLADWSGSTSTAAPKPCRLPGSALELDGRAVGFVGGSARHYELGPIALGLIKRNVDPAATLTVGGIAASQELLVDPEVGLHVRPRL